MQFETVIKARIPRTNCPEHGVRSVHIPWASPHGRFTLLFEAFAIRVLGVASTIDRGRLLLLIDGKIIAPHDWSDRKEALAT